MNRERLLAQVPACTSAWDVVVIGGGATGAGIAVDAATRGFSVLLLERFDFGSGTSSRSTKLIHGGVRYLRQGHIPLVFEALHERSRLRRNAPHLVHDLEFIIPSYRWRETPFYGLGLTIYDLLAGHDQFGSARMLSCGGVVRRIPTIQRSGLKGGVVYHDGQFDDSRLLIDLLRTAQQHGAVPLNYAPVVGLLTNPAGRVTGVQFRDAESKQAFEVSARIVINATGVFVDGVRRMIRPGISPLVAPSQGSHLVFDRRFLPGASALMVPKTIDGRVLFAIPWLGHTLVGTTDVGVPNVEAEPRATEAEIDFILATAGRYLQPAPTRSDILSKFTGVRPLVQDHAQTATANLSREHVILEEPAGLLTITGGKWTTYRRMAEQVVDHAITSASLPTRSCRTKTLRIVNSRISIQDELQVNELGVSVERIRHAVDQEMARTVEDVLARRTRALFLNARAAIDNATRVAEVMADCLSRDTSWKSQQVRDFTKLAEGYLADPAITQRIATMPLPTGHR